MTHILFITKDFDREVKPYQQQIDKGIIKVIKTGKTVSLIHADTFEQIEKYLLRYSYNWLHFENRLTLFKRKVQDKDISDYVKSWDKPDKLNALTKEFNITGDLQAWINFFVREIYLQPAYYYEATKKYPNTLPYESRIFQRWYYLNEKTRFAQNKYNELVQKEYRKLRKLLSIEDKEAIKTIKAIVYFTDNLLSEAPDYLYSSPIMAAFIHAMLDLKKLYDLTSPNNGLPLMDKYFNNAYVSQFEVKDTHFDKDAIDNQPPPETTIIVKEEVREHYFKQLEDYFSPKEQFENFIYTKDFTIIDFNGTQAQLAGIFKLINENQDLIRPSWESTAKYISIKFTVRGKKINEKTLNAYFTGKKKLSDKNQIEIRI